MPAPPLMKRSPRTRSLRPVTRDRQSRPEWTKATCLPIIDLRGQRVEQVLADGNPFGEGPLPAVMPLVVAPELDRLGRYRRTAGPTVWTTPAISRPTINGNGKASDSWPLRIRGVHRIDADCGGLDEHVGRADRGLGQFAELDALGGPTRSM